MMDVIPVLPFMSLALQKEHVELASVQAMVKSTVTQIRVTTANSCPRFCHHKMMFQKLNGERTLLK